MSELAAIEAHQAALAEIAHLNKQIDMLVEQVNSMVNQLDRAEDEVAKYKMWTGNCTLMSCHKRHFWFSDIHGKDCPQCKLLADCKVMAETVLLEHGAKNRCYAPDRCIRPTLYPEESKCDPTCQYYHCTCDACTVARRYCGN